MKHRIFKDEVMWESLFKDYFAGMSARKCGRRYGMSQYTVLRRLTKEGLKRTPEESMHLLKETGSRKGANHPRWKGGRWFDSYGYANISIGNEKRRREHVLIAEEILGRHIKPSEMVHHVNFNKSDNRHSNLIICTQAYHRWLHHHMAELYVQEHFSSP